MATSADVFVKKSNFFIGCEFQSSICTSKFFDMHTFRRHLIFYSAANWGWGTSKLPSFLLGIICKFFHPLHSFYFFVLCSIVSSNKFYVPFNRCRTPVWIYILRYAIFLGKRDQYQSVCKSRHWCQQSGDSVSFFNAIFFLFKWMYESQMFKLSC